MSIEQLHSLLLTTWIVWFFLLFGGIVTWALLPARREKFERARQIPLREAE
ncbi:cbb3-type cytochrome c oxidase subunit 3 [Roseomonas sp. SSH11]|uniref:Cbb3-type cytochrome c oxidase subunit 3 n=1 Tax=Pararoseomonas baculiformis TaxID=2820812 RepID=A0ABS4AJE0_9PROT|nr:cbb3-type cytochrome c oxidase subunit 3 [Pararoseomonas baculiformis]MBP0447132.1 cbb3-type cytochrome c oxidase subunit 3 [Pararoseomonas baculiformis]